MEWCRWQKSVRHWWQVGNKRVFRLSPARCRDLIEAIARCDGQIHGTFSLDILSDGSFKHAASAATVAVMFAISLPEGSEELFESIMGAGTLEEPPKLHMNATLPSQP